jgi:predicted esterase
MGGQTQPPSFEIFVLHGFGAEHMGYLPLEKFLSPNCLFRAIGSPYGVRSTSQLFVQV